MSRETLRSFSDDDLIEELARRRNDRSKRKPERWCQDCARFVPWGIDNKMPMPENYNPCSKGHAMKFHTPESLDDEFGYFVHICADREDAPGVPKEGGARD